LAQTKVENVRRLFAAIADRDVGAAKEIVDSKVQLFAPKTGAETGQPYHLYLGHPGTEQYFQHIATVWREFEFNPREYRERDEYVIALGSLRSRSRSGPARDDDGAWGIRFRDGTIAWARAYLRRRDALREIPMPNIEIVSRLLDAARARDLEATIALVSPSLEFEAPVTAAATGKKVTYRGRDGLREFFTTSTDAFEELYAQVDHYLEVGDHVVGFGHLRGRTAGGDEVDSSAQWLWRITDEQIVWACEHTDAEAALRAAGLVAS
jgi:ketosteroid isomerase-like protein